VGLTALNNAGRINVAKNGAVSVLGATTTSGQKCMVGNRGLTRFHPALIVATLLAAHSRAAFAACASRAFHRP